MTIDVVKFVEDWKDKHRDYYAEPREVLNALLNDLSNAVEVEYVGPLYRTDYFVAGQGEFPLDMLRYTESWPATEGDSHSIECAIRAAALGISGEGPSTIKLTKYHRDPKPVLSEDRWRSKFGWKLVGVVETTEL